MELKNEKHILEEKTTLNSSSFFNKSFYSMLLMIIVSISGLFRFIYFSNFLTTQFYGIYSQIILITTTLSLIIIFGSDYTIKKLIPSRKKTNFNEMIFIILFIIIITFLGLFFVSILLLGYPSKFADIFLANNDLLPFFPKLIIICWIFVSNYILEYLAHTFYIFNKLCIIYSIYLISLVFSVIFFVFPNPSINKLIINIIITNGIKTIFLLCFVFIEISKNRLTREKKDSDSVVHPLSRKILIKIIIINQVSFGILALSDYFLRNFDSLFISSQLSSFEYAIYSFYYQIGLIIMQIILGLKNLLNPYFNEFSISNNFLKDLNRFIINVSCFIYSFLISFKKGLFLIIQNQDYEENFFIFYFIIFSFLVMSYNIVQSSIIFSEKKLKHYVLPLISAAIIVFLLDFIFVEHYGIFFPPIARFLGYVFVFIYYLVFLFRKKNIFLFSWKNIVPLGFLIIIMFFQDSIINYIVITLNLIWIIYSERKIIKLLVKKQPKIIPT